ncbi:hypothetical protein ACWEKJ_30415 [Amycolatopsis thermoflava]|uniref:hypothetical protein n=1 Tax=Amycolatopsis sp. NPDC006125 TaxID=3156730 RepID=UPI0033A61142
MANEALRGRRGPKPNPDRGTPTGYRVPERIRFELQMAATFIGTTSLQETIAVAVEEFLQRMHRIDGFRQALEAAERSQQHRRGVTRIPQTSTRGTGTDDNAAGRE